MSDDYLIDVLQNREKRFHCKDWKDKKGCGLERRAIKDKKDKTQWCNPRPVPTYDFDGNMEYRLVPHWVSCPENFEYMVDWYKDNEQKYWDYKNGQDSNGGGSDRGRRSSGSGGRRSRRSES